MNLLQILDVIHGSTPEAISSSSSPWIYILIIVACTLMLIAVALIIYFLNKRNKK